MTERERIESLHQKYLSLRENTPEWQRDGEECKAYHEWYDNAYVFFKSFSNLLDDPDYQVFVNANKSGNCFALEHTYDSISPSYKVLLLKTEEMRKAVTDTPKTKTSKIFISHSGNDHEVVDALVDLLGEIINLSDKNLFCSSAHGFDVKVGENFMDNIMEQYNNHDLFLLYVFSHNYMRSPICLNEMGASWITKKDSVGILLPGFDLEDLGNSCYDKQSISVIFNQNDSEVNHRLNQLKDRVEFLFPTETKNISVSRWEEKRNKFKAVVNSIPEANKGDFSEVIHLEEQAIVKPKASIASSVSPGYYRGRGSYIITFLNQGRGPAENLTVGFDDVVGINVSLEKELFPIEILKPGQSFQVIVKLAEGAPHKIMSQIRWKEDGKEFADKELVLFNK